MKEILIYSIQNLSKKLNVLWIFLFTGGNKDIDLYKTKDENFKIDVLSVLIKVLRLFIFILLGYIISFILNTHFPKYLEGLKLNIENQYILILYLLVLCFAAIIGFIKVIRYQYRVSRKQFEFFILLSSIYLFVRFDGKHFILFSKNFEFLDYFVSIFSIFFFGSILNYGWPKFNKADNYFFEDNPLKESSSEIEKNMIEKLKLSVIKDKYELSFSIGIIGPWGLGKSSFLNQLKSEILEEIDRYPFYDEKLITYTPQRNVIGAQEIIFFEFSPFLNHNEDTVINDFFTQLNNHLNKRSGKLSQALQEYSEKLIKLVDKNKIYQFTKGSNGSEKSVNELYDEVIEILNELELKFIIFIDDMDRLNPKEILQVLKLIRNTSNFPNFVFIVALDKEYVINALRSMQDYSSKNYIDKFFQLECFLPEIESTKIIDATITLIDKKGIIPNAPKNIDGLSMREKLSQVISDEMPLFIEYIQNYRDVKRFVNQFHFEYDNITNLLKEVSIKDYLNLMLLKSKFPEYYRQIAMNYGNIFEVKDGVISLLPNEETTKSSNNILNELVFIQNTKYYRPNLDNYKFDSNLDCKTKKKYTCVESDLIKRTLFEIFENFSNNKPDPLSLRRVSNLKKIIYWRLTKSDFTSEKYQELIDYYSLAQNWDIESRSLHNLKNIDSDNKLEELILKLNFEFPEDIEKIKAIILIAFDILRISSSNNRINNKVIELLEMFYNVKMANGATNKTFTMLSETNRKDLFIQNYLKATEIDLIDKIDLINDLIDKYIFTGFWHFDKTELLNFQLELISEEVKKYNSDNWLPNDYIIFRSYYMVRENFEKENLIQRLNDIIKSFFTNKKLNVLFFNLLNPEVWSQSAYRLNEIINLVYGNINNFVGFLQLNYKKELKEFPQISEFLRLNNIVQNTFDLKFDFDETILIGHFHGWGKPSEIDRENTKNAFQLFFETDLSPVGYTFEMITPRHSQFLYNSNGKTYFLFVSNKNHTDIDSFVHKILECFQNNILNRHSIKTKIEVELSQNIAKLIDAEEKTAFNLISNK